MRLTTLASLALAVPAAAQSFTTDSALESFTPTAATGSYSAVLNGCGEYLHDDGGGNAGVGVNSAAAGILWLQHFDAGAGDTITSISTFFGNPGSGSATWPPAGQAAAVYLWDDPTNDGDPSDAVLLVNQPTIVTESGTGRFQVEAIPPTAVTGIFFVGAASDGGTFPAPLDNGTASLGRAWITGSTAGFAGLDPVVLTNTAANNVGLFELDAIAIPGVWMTRAQGSQPELTTTFAGGNGLSGGNDMVLFDMAVLNPNGVTIDEIDINTAEAVGTECNIHVYMTDGTYVGVENDQTAWRYVASGKGFAAGQNLPTNIDVDDFGVPAGKYGFAVYYVDCSVRYTNGAVTYADANMQLDVGTSKSGLFSGSTFTPRGFNGTLRYCSRAIDEPAPYCVSTVNSNGCSGGVVMNGTPSVTAGSFLVRAENVLNRKPGLLIYSPVSAALPFMGGTLCVGKPISRTPAQPTNGSPKPANDCTGTMAFDFGAYIQGGGDPGIVAGSQVFAQYMHRDPGSATGWGLTSGGQFTMQP